MTKHMNYSLMLSGPLGLESLCKKELEKLGCNISTVTDKAVYFSGTDRDIVRANLWSRFGNSVYIIALERDNITDFDSYFDLVAGLDWKKYIPEGFMIHVKATSLKSEIESLSSIQSLGKKAIVGSLTTSEFLREDAEKGVVEVRMFFDCNKLKVLINTTGPALHKRGYRELTGGAPIKENIAAALVILSGWKYKQPLYDLFCGSGTIAIEALMIAKNIAPGRLRKFAFETWDYIDPKILTEEKNFAEEKQFDGEYKIYASDIRKTVVESAKRSAAHAGLDGQIEFSCQDFNEVMRKGAAGYIVSNPPYGVRLDEDNAEQIHIDLAKIFMRDDIFGGIISSHDEFENLGKIKWKKRKIYNGGERCYFYKKNER